MAHQRKLVRQAVVALLTNATSAGARVFDTRRAPHKRSLLPAIVVYTLREPDVVESGEAPRELERVVRAEIAGYVADTEAVPLGDAMDDLAEQIEAVMDANRYLGGAAAESVLESTEMMVPTEDDRSDPPVGIVVLTYAVTYRTEPTVGPLDDFITVHTDHEVVSAVTDTPPASDRFTVQEVP